MTGGERPVLHQLQNGRAEAQQTQRVCDRRAGFAHAGRRLLLRHFIGAHELLIAERLFDRVEVRALQVFDERELHRLLVIGLDDDDRHVGKPREPRRAPAALAGDDLIKAGRQLADRQRLDDAVHADRLGERSELVRVEGFSGLQGIRLDLLQRQADRALRRRFGLLIDISEQGAKALAETFLRCHSRSSSQSDSFARISCATASYAAAPRLNLS